MRNNSPPSHPKMAATFPSIGLRFFTANGIFPREEGRERRRRRGRVSVSTRGLLSSILDDNRGVSGDIGSTSPSFVFRMSFGSIFLSPSFLLLLNAHRTFQAAPTTTVAIPTDTRPCVHDILPWDREEGDEWELMLVFV